VSVKCAIIGCGLVVDDLHMPALRAIPGLEVVAACDLDQPRLHAFSERHGIQKKYETVDGFLSAESTIDFVIIATPGSTHLEIGSKVMDAGFNVLFEKPVARTLAETLILRDLAARKNLKAGVIQNYRYRDNVLRAREDYSRGRVGSIKQVNVTFHGQSVFNEATPWSWNERKTKTLVYETAVHFLDIETMFAGRISRIIGGHSVYDKILDITERIYALVEHEKGAIGIIDLQYHASSNYIEVEIFGTANDIRLKFSPEYYRIYSGNINPMDEVGFNIKRITDFALPILLEKFIRPVVTRRARSHYRLFQNYVKALSGSLEKIPVSLDDIVPTMELVEEVSRLAYGKIKS